MKLPFAVLVLCTGSFLLTVSAVWVPQNPLRTDFEQDVDALSDDTNYQYGDANGPINWYNPTSAANKACATGVKQSPILLDNNFLVVDGSRPTLKLPLAPVAGLKLINRNTTLQVDTTSIKDATLTTTAGVTYFLQQFHFHTPSEHRVHFEYFPLEVHFVFKSPGKVSQHIEPTILIR